MFVLQSPIVVLRLTLELHGTKSHAQPAVESFKLLGDGRERGRKIVSHASDHRVDSVDSGGVQVVTANGQFAETIFEFLHGLGSHAVRSVSDLEAQEGEPFQELRDLGLLWAEFQSQRS